MACPVVVTAARLFPSSYGPGSAASLRGTVTNGIFSAGSTSPSATQKVLANERRARTSAPVAGKCRSHWSSARERLAFRRRQLRCGIALGPLRRTPMRHGLSPSAITAGPQGMSCAPAGARLVAPAGPTLIFSTGFLRTVSAAIDLAPIAAATDERLSTTATTQEEASRLSDLDSWRAEA
jgi:hypothetical protein